MEITAAQLAKLIQGSIEGDPDVVVQRPARIEEAKPGDFAFIDHPKYERFAYSTRASVLLVHRTFAVSGTVHPTLIRVDNVRDSLARLLEAFEARLQAQGESGISEKAVIHPSAQISLGVHIGHLVVVDQNAIIGEGTFIQDQAYIGPNVRVGRHCRIYSGARIHADTVVGDHCIIHANAVIGADGFGYAPQPESQAWKKMPQVGNVVLEDDVEIGACTCIDRASIGSTVIRRGAKLDNLIHIAHNVEVGQHTAIAAQVGIAGSTQIGDHCQIGGQAGFVGHVRIADGTRVQAQSGISSGIEQPNTALFGSPAIPYKDYIKSYAIFKQLPEMERRLRDVERRLREAHRDDPGT